MELTWDVYNKQNNKCGFACFCREDRQKFYSNEHHDISYETEEKDMVKATRIYSEMNLLVNDAELRDKISNYLLSENRVAKKINGFNGYVGYVEKGSMINYYNPNIESSLNIQR